MILDIGVGVVKVLCQGLLYLLRAIMSYLPRDVAKRELSSLEETLTILSYDGEKLLFSESRILISMIGWFIIYTWGIDPMIRLVKMLKGW